MKVPQINCLGYFGVRNCVKKKCAQSSLSPIKHDCVSFSSNAQYMRKYVTLPEEIKKILNPKDAIDMFKEMEFVALGLSKGHKIGQGDFSFVYENPWLDGYDLLIAQDLNSDSQIIYSKHKLGNSVWADSDNNNIQIIKRLS